MSILKRQMRQIVTQQDGGTYSSWLNIVQSSGTGKTRAVFEAATSWGIPIFYVRGEDAQGEDDSGYPPPTTNVFQFLMGTDHPPAAASNYQLTQGLTKDPAILQDAILTQAPSSSTSSSTRAAGEPVAVPVDSSAAVPRLPGSVIASVAADADAAGVAADSSAVTTTPNSAPVQSTRSSPVIRGGVSEADLAAYCRCAAFMQVAKQKTDAFRARNPIPDTARAVAFWKNQLLQGENFWDIEILRSRADALLSRIKATPSVGAGWITWENAVKDFLGVEACTGRHPQFIVLIDECRYFRYGISGAATDVLAPLGRAARLLWAWCAIMVSMDTLSDVIALPKQKLFSSSRASFPLTKQMVCTRLLNWDLNFTPASTLGDVMRPAHIFRCGRPLWSAMAAAGDLRMFPERIFEFIGMKLLCASEGDNILTTTRAAAIVCSRVALDTNPYTQLSKELVGSHLAHLDHYDNESGRAVTSYLAEAPLAHACRAFWQEDGKLARSLEEIVKITRTREFQAGERGEVAAQIVLLDVADKVSYR
jgi:hypothetical protein